MELNILPLATASLSSCHASRSARQLQPAVSPLRLSQVLLTSGQHKSKSSHTRDDQPVGSDCCLSQVVALLQSTDSGLDSPNACAACAGTAAAAAAGPLAEPLQLATRLSIEWDDSDDAVRLGSCGSTDLFGLPPAPHTWCNSGSSSSRHCSSLAASRCMSDKHVGCKTSTAAAVTKAALLAAAPEASADVPQAYSSSSDQQRRARRPAAAAANTLSMAGPFGGNGRRGDRASGGGGRRGTAVMAGTDIRAVLGSTRLGHLVPFSDLLVWAAPHNTPVSAAVRHVSLLLPDLELSPTRLAPCQLLPLAAKPAGLQPPGPAPGTPTHRHQLLSAALAGNVSDVQSRGADQSARGAVPAAVVGGQRGLVVASAVHESPSAGLAQLKLPRLSAFSAYQLPWTTSPRPRLGALGGLLLEGQEQEQGQEEAVDHLREVVGTPELIEQLRELVSICTAHQRELDGMDKHVAELKVRSLALLSCTRCTATQRLHCVYRARLDVCSGPHCPTPVTFVTVCLCCVTQTHCVSLHRRSTAKTWNAS